MPRMARRQWGRVDPGGRPPGSPTEPDVQDSRIRLLGLWFRCVTVSGMDSDRQRKRIMLQHRREARPINVATL